MHSNMGSIDSMRADQDRVRKLLSETVVMLCKSGLRYDDLEIKGVIAVTTNKKDVFVVHIDDRQVSGEVKREPCQASPCTTSEIEQQFSSNQVPAKRIKVEDSSSYQGYPPISYNTAVKNVNHMSNLSSQKIAPQFFTDDIDNQTPLKTISSTSQMMSESPNNNPNQWALAIPNAVRHQAPSQVNNAMMQHIRSPPRMMPRLVRQNVNGSPVMRQPMASRAPQGMQGGRMMVLPSPNQQVQQQRCQMPRMPAMQHRPVGGGRGSRGGMGRGRAKSLSMGDVEMVAAGKVAVDSKTIDGFSYGKQTVTQYICNICNKTFHSHSGLLTHQVKSHGRQKKAGVGRRPKNESVFEEDEEGDFEYADDSFDQDYAP